MAHFAQIDENNLVTQVIVVSNQELTDANGQESEALGIAFCQTLFPGTQWRQTSYNATFRKNYAGVGYTYDAGRDAFIAPKPFDSWILDEATCQWSAPTPYPTDGKSYVWDESSQTWIETQPE